MRYILENDNLIAEFDSFGAELKSVKNKTTGLEYIWNGDPKYWGRTAPVLFPFVGSLKDGKYTFEDKEYKMTSHGFARDKEHELLRKSDDEIWFTLKDSPETYGNYPFHFEFQNGYKLEGNTISVFWRVYNPGQERTDETLYFSVGAHPAFACKEKSGCRLYFKGADEIRHHGNLTGTCTHESLTLKLTDNRAIITPDFFDRSTYIIEGGQTNEVGIETPEGHRFITVTFNAPLFAIWSPEKKNAPFICIEPWYGRADYDDYSGDLTLREYGNRLAAKETFENVYTIKFD